MLCVGRGAGPGVAAPAVVQGKPYFMLMPCRAMPCHHMAVTHHACRLRLSLAAPCCTMPGHAQLHLAWHSSSGCGLPLPTPVPPHPCPLQRPLSAAQQQYAAADAACLLALLGSLIAAVGQPDERPMVEPAVEAASAQSSANTAAAAAGTDGSGADAAEVADEGAEVCAAKSEAANGNSSRCSSSSDGASEQRGAAGASQTQQQQQEQQVSSAAAAVATAAPASPADLLGGCTLQQLQAASSAWGVRLEISGARTVKRGGRRGQRQRREARRGSGRLEPEASCPFPLHVPFWDAQRQVRRVELWLAQRTAWSPAVQRVARCQPCGCHAVTNAAVGLPPDHRWQFQTAASNASPLTAQPTGPPRFLCDVMAEGLARQLRLCGFDTGGAGGFVAGMQGGWVA